MGVNDNDEDTPMAKRPVSPEEMLGLALISLATPLAGKMLGGNDGAMIGAQAGLGGAGKYLGARADDAKEQDKFDRALAQKQSEREEKFDDAVALEEEKARIKGEKDPGVKPVKNAKGQVIDANTGSVIDASTPPPKPAKLGGKTPDPAKASKDAGKAEDALRREFTNRPEVKHAQAVETAYDAMLQAKPTAQGDISLIFQYMKMLDPGSVVREGEFANAQNAAGIPDRVRNIYNKAMTGERLGDEQRASILSEAEGLVSAARATKQNVASEYGRIVTERGGKAQNVVVEGHKPQPAPKPAAKDLPAHATKAPEELSDEERAAELKRLRGE